MGTDKNMCRLLANDKRSIKERKCNEDVVRVMALPLSESQSPGELLRLPMVAHPSQPELYVGLRDLHVWC